MASKKPIYGPTQNGKGYYDAYRNRPVSNMQLPNVQLMQNNNKLSSNSYVGTSAVVKPGIPEYYYANKNTNINNNYVSNVPQGGTSTNVGYSYSKPNAITNYDWDTGAGLLTPDSPLIQPVVYKNEFSPESTMSMAQDVYNKYYADMVAEQQRKNTQAYRDTAAEAAATAGAAGMATGSRGSVQLQNQANREAQAANLEYQQQQQLQAFQDTLNARQLELQNKIADYENAWKEVQQYGYVVTEETGKLLGIKPGQQLTTLDYKTTMSNIAQAVANAEAEKVRLNQQQQQIDAAWAEFQEGIRQYEKDYALNEYQVKNSVTNTLYERLIDMLGRYDTVTPEMAALGAQVGMSMQVGSSTAQYMSEAEIQAQRNNETSFTNNATLEQMATSFIPSLKQIGGINNPSKFANWLAQQVANGSSAIEIQQLIQNTKGDALAELGIANTNSAKEAAKSAVIHVMNSNGLAGNMSIDDMKKAEKQLTGTGWFTGDFMYALNIVTNKNNGVQKSNVTVYNSNGKTRTYTLPAKLDDLYSIANDTGLWNSGVGGIGNPSDRQAAITYLAQYFYSNGRLKPSVRLQYY